MNLCETTEHHWGSPTSVRRHGDCSIFVLSAAVNDPVAGILPPTCVGLRHQNGVASRESVCEESVSEPLTTGGRAT